jgi:two-component system nitrate/nitrite response regulator NarL
MTNTYARPAQVFVVAPAIPCWGLERLVQTAHPRMELVGSAPTLDQSRPALERGNVDVLLITVENEITAEVLGGLQSFAGMRIVLLASRSEPEFLDSAVLAGVRGVVRTSDPALHLLKAIERVHDGELWIDRAAPGRIFMHLARQSASQANDPERMKIATLTSRERQTIAAVTSDAGAPGKVIASRLCISEHTLRNHLSSIYAKLGLNNRVDLFAYASRHNLQGSGASQGR